MAWIESHQTLARHRKTLRAAHILQVDRHKLIGHLMCLWWWGIDNAGVDGYVERHMVPIAAEWDGDPEAFTNALIEAGFIDQEEDGALRLHDWYDYAGKLIEQRAKDAARKRAERKRARDQEPPGDVQRTSDGHPEDVRRNPTVPIPNLSDLDLDPPLLSPPKPKQRRKKETESTPDPRVQPVLRAFHDCYLARFGKPPPKVHLDFGRDGKRIRQLPEAYTTEELLQLIERFFNPETPGWVTRDFSFGAFLLSLPKLQEVSLNGLAGVPGDHAASGRGRGGAQSTYRGREAETHLGADLDRGFFASAL